MRIFQMSQILLELEQRLAKEQEEREKLERENQRLKNNYETRVF